MSLPIALQLYSVRNECGKDFYRTLKAVKEAGYDGVELAGLHGYSVEDVKNMLAELNLDPISAHVSIEEISEDPLSIEKYSRLGVRYIVIPYLSLDNHPNGVKWDETRDIINSAIDKASEFGIKMLYHNHDFEFKKIDGKYIMDIFLSEIDRIGYEPDTCWINYAGEDPVEYIKKYSSIIPVVHLKDFVMPGRKSAVPYKFLSEKEDNASSEVSKFKFMPLGEGVQDIKAILSTAESFAEWVIVEQDYPGDYTELEAMKKSIEYLKSL